ncbi:hypothetical protein ACFVXG_20460 [Kitasatospora sp. NPDC058162]|uniref:hypothetical protein n=1 Tax=Kitasatospora sp. NPDC058162 TaxID=3346362 RepID=UPI0036DB1667
MTAINDRKGVPLTTDELRRRAIAAAANAESALRIDPPRPETAQAWVAVSHALIAAAAVQAQIEAETRPNTLASGPGDSLR